MLLVLRNSLLALFIACFAFTAVYVPQIHPLTPEKAYADGDDGANIWAAVTSAVSAVKNTITAYASTVSLGLQQQQWFKEYVLDGIAWTIAKNAVSMMTRSIVRWINSGFQGSPAFIQDLGGFLTDVADQTMGQYIQELAGPLSFVCSPFRLNIQIAVATAYNRTRDKNARRCTLSGTLQNIQNFVSGDMGQGGWDSWIQIAHNPYTYSPYGSALEAVVESRMVIQGAQGEQLDILKWTNGFLSQVFCNTTSAPAQGPNPDGSTVDSTPTPSRDCPITTPGNVISMQLNHTLGLGADSLIAADEFNEILGALLNQLVTQVIGGVNGLLGMSGSGRYSNPNFNVDLYTPGMELTTDPTTINKLLTDAITSETEMIKIARWTIDRYENSYNTDPNKQSLADSAYAEAKAALPLAQNNLAQLNKIASNSKNAITEEARQKAMEEYMLIASRLHNQAKVDNARQSWEFALSSMATRDDGYVDRRSITAAIALENDFLDIIDRAIDNYRAISSPTTGQRQAYDEATEAFKVVQDNLITLQKLINNYEKDEVIWGNEGSYTNSRDEAIAEFKALEEDLHTKQEIDSIRYRWERSLGTLVEIETSSNN